VITDCIIFGSVRAAIPLADLASWNSITYGPFCASTTTTSTTESPFPIGYYYQTYKYLCNNPFGPCSIVDTGIVAYSSVALIPGNYYNSSGDGFVYLPNIQLDNPQAYDINLSLAPSFSDCVDACNI
jgi:hypothetical protein